MANKIELAVAHNHLEACQSWQEVISAQTTVAGKDEAGREALMALRNQTFHNTRQLIVSGDVAMFFPDGIDRLEEGIWPVMQFGELQAQGWLGRLSYKRIRQEAFIAWTLYNPTVLGPADDEFISPDVFGEMEDEPLYRLPLLKPLDRPLHFPVSLINYALCYQS